MLRFLHVEGITEMALAGAVPTVSGWTGTWLPRGVDAGSVRRLLVSCDRASAQGCRDYAVLMMLARLGVRVGEIAALQLDDIDWHHGEVLIQGQGAAVGAAPVAGGRRQGVGRLPAQGPPEERAP